MVAPTVAASQPLISPAVANGVFAATDDAVRDFTHHIDVRFRIDGDEFVGRPGIAAAKLIEFLALMDAQDEKSTDSVGLIHAAFNLMLTAESAERFNARIADEDNPISMDQVNEVQTFLMERYGMRPTSPSVPSSPGPDNPDAGTSSTQGGLSEGPIASPSEQTASST